MVESYTARRVIGEGALETLPTTTTHFHDEAFHWSQGTHSTALCIYMSLYTLLFVGFPFVGDFNYRSTRLQPPPQCWLGTAGGRC
ncbi:hypothetical protein Ddc_11929 [Ditylenchus destructor]|nr:hypothetical protein Ddc_11929 [Ditylenchus destructor]